ncbi:RasGEF domain-containing protein [uncultured Legionella sp.]|uniref:RasGEF domain-containing protein n=1 Tax=uncultured Legionella sp. TaxID=210934 RepID=UPI002626515F|nr:RasGEF domain-containing protein [uncultured Legionella sp.]
MSGNDLRSWLNDHRNQQFWLNPLPSEQFDVLISQTPIQKSISGSKKNRLIYSYIENKIVSDYTQLIDFKLREVFYNLGIDEFREPKGFERQEKSSQNQRNYFEVREQLEFFLKQDIQQHQNNPDAQLNAFRRWIEISDSLLKRHCYEGFLLVFINLQLMAKPHLIDGLPTKLQHNFHELCKINSPAKNHSALRHFINKNTNERDFTPLFLTNHDITMINESIIQIGQQELLLNNRKKAVFREINRLRGEMDPTEFDKVEMLVRDDKKNPIELDTENIALIDLLRESRKIPEQIKLNHSILAEQLKQRSALLNLIKKEQRYKVQTLPEHLENTYDEISLRFGKYKRDQESIQEPVSARDARPSKLYSRHLLPSFWQRTGKSEARHWEDMFTPSCLYKR